MEPHADIVAETTRLVDAAAASGVPLRALGGVAVALHASDGVHPALARPYADIDLVTTRRGGRDVLALLVEHGYQPNDRFNAMNGGRRLVVYDVHNARQLDVFVGDFEMCHRIPIADRLALEPRTIPLAELLLTKLQVVHVNRKDVLDICAILLDHEVADTDTEAVNAAYVAALLAGDWGLWRTSRGTIGATRRQLPELALGDAERAVVDDRLAALWERIEAQPKTLRWRGRARVGERTRWYLEPEEVEHRPLGDGVA